MNNSKYILFNSFDRAGSTAIVKTLGLNESVEYLIHPFNGGPFRKSMYQIFDDKIASTDDHNFFKNLVKGELKRDYIVSWWHEKFSSTINGKKNKLHILKTTINHFSIKWIYDNYPLIDVWGVWRDPWEILNSILKNDFHGKWYDDAFDEIKDTIFKESEFEEYKLLYNEADSPTKRTAFLISARSYYFFLLLKKNFVINYHEFLKEPQTVYDRFVNNYKLQADEDVYNFAKQDLNVVGSKLSGNKVLSHLNDDEIEYVSGAYRPLMNLMSNKYKF